MEEELFNILLRNYRYTDISYPALQKATKQIFDHLKQFLDWKDDFRCPFLVSNNGEDKTRPKVSYKKGDKFFTFDELYKFWLNNPKL